MPSTTFRRNDPDDKDLITIDDVSKEAKGLIDKVIKDVGKTSATKQLIIGCTSGWLTGYLMMKVGKMAAVAVGGGIILLQVANHNGYVKINWDRLYKKVDDIGEKIEASSSKGPKLMDKVRKFAEENTYMAAGYTGGVERFVDRKLDKVEGILKKKERKAKKWYYKFMHDEDYFMFQEIHVFLASFIAGMALGLAFGKI
ncbi:hypothetical protein AAG570_002464 [Ranatra chinensis]|uniref:FUN14 domain-containing protein 1 n=1 Tax=Ranatra chinensis TaxID=642074 RepID=A0ABD0YLR6_9HEMI